MRTWTKRQRLTDQKWEVLCDDMPDAEIAFWGPRAEEVARFIVDACNAAERWKATECPVITFREPGKHEEYKDQPGHILYGGTIDTNACNAAERAAEDKIIDGARYQLLQAHQRETRPELP